MFICENSWYMEVLNGFASNHNIIIESILSVIARVKIQILSIRMKF